MRLATHSPSRQLNILDRNNIANAKVSGMSKDLKFNNLDYNNAILAMFVGYVWVVSAHARYGNADPRGTVTSRCKFQPVSSWRRSRPRSSCPARYSAGVSSPCAGRPL